MVNSKLSIAALEEIGENLCQIYIQDDDSFPGGIWSWRVYIDGNHHARGPGSTRKDVLKWYATVTRGTHRIVIRDSKYPHPGGIESNTLYFTIDGQMELIIFATYCKGSINLSVGNQ